MLFPLLALGTMAFGALTRARPGRRRALRLLYFALIWLIADTSALFMCLGLWLASGFGGRLRTEPFQARHYAVMEWFLNLIYNAGTSTFGVRVEVEEPPLTAEEEAARLARPVIVLSWTPGPATRSCSCVTCSRCTTGGRGSCWKATMRSSTPVSTWC